MCTTVIVGRLASKNGSVIIARNCDAEDMIVPLRFIKCPEVHEKGRVYKSVNTGFEAPLPENALAFTMAPFLPQDNIGHFGEAGFNSENVAMSSTESIYGNDRVLALDPLVSNGIGEDSLLDLVLPYIHSARDGVSYLGKLIEKYGSHEGNGVMFADRDEAWYMEIPCGHKWAAKRIPDDEVAVISNMTSLQEIDFNDPENYMWCDGLREFVDENHLNPSRTEWIFRDIFGTSRALDRRYNTPRVWYSQNYLGRKSENPNAMDMPFSFKADRLVDIEDVSYVLSSHYQETDYDPLRADLPQDMRKKYRPISMERCAESHILEVRRDVPKEYACIFWYNFAPTAFNPYVPFYANATDTASQYNQTSMTLDYKQAYWTNRLLAVLAERDYNEMYSIVGNYLDESFKAAIAHIKKTDEKASQTDNIEEVLTHANQEIADCIEAKKHDCIQQLMVHGMELSALRYDVNTDVL